MAGSKLFGFGKAGNFGRERIKNSREKKIFTVDLLEGILKNTNQFVFYQIIKRND